MKDFKFCTKCGNKSRITANVCANCGKHFRKVIVKTAAGWCPNCSSLQRSGAKFCRICGYQFVPSTPTEEPIDQAHIPGIELPPPAKVPQNPNPSPTQQPAPKRSGASGLILTADEIKRLRRMKTDQILIYPRSQRKPNK